MKYAIRLTLICALAIGSAGCGRDDARDESVSANTDERRLSDDTRRSEQSETKRQATRTTEREVKRSAENKIDNTAAANRKPEPRTGAPVREVEPAAENRTLQNTRTRTTETVAEGTAIMVTLADSLSTDANKVGDSFTAHLSQPIVVNGKVVAEKGDRVTGHIAKLDEPGRVKGRARLELVLDDIRTSRDTRKLATEPFIAVAEDTHERDAAEVAGGAAVGAVIGAVTGGKKGAAIGAVIGGGTGTTAVLLTKGKQLKLEPETKVNFVLSRDVNLPVIRTATT